MKQADSSLNWQRLHRNIACGKKEFIRQLADLVIVSIFGYIQVSSPANMAKLTYPSSLQRKSCALHSLDIGGTPPVGTVLGKWAVQRKGTSCRLCSTFHSLPTVSMSKKPGTATRVGGHMYTLLAYLRAPSPPRERHGHGRLQRPHLNCVDIAN